MVVSFGMGRNPLISGASYRNILKIGPFCFGVAGKLGTKFVGPLIIVGNAGVNRPKKTIAPKHGTSRLFKISARKHREGYCFDRKNSEFAGPLFLLMACGGALIYAKRQISYERLPDSDLCLYLRYAKNDFRCSTHAIDDHYNCRA